MEIDAVLGKNEKRNYFYAAFTIRKAREEAVGDRLIALVLFFSKSSCMKRAGSFDSFENADKHGIMLLAS